MMRKWTVALLFATAVGAAPTYADDQQTPPEGTTEQPAAPETTTPAAPTGDGSGVYTKDSWPLRLVDRPLTFAKGMLAIDANLGVNLSTSMVGKPIAIGIGASYGLTDDFTLNVQIPTLCVTGKDNGCAEFLGAFAVGARYNVLRGKLFSLAPGVSIGGNASDPVLARINIGTTGYLHPIDMFQLYFALNIGVGLTDRDFNKESLSLQLAPRVQVMDQLALYVNTGIAGPLDGFGDAFMVPVGVGGLFAVNKMVDLGLNFTFDNLAGKNGGADARSLGLFTQIRL